MSDIELAVKIPEETAKEIKDNAMFAKEISDHIKWGVTSAIVNGTPLPKGHGGLIDLEEVRDRYVNIIKVSNSELENLRMLAEILDTSPTIIEADRSEEV